MKKLTGKAIKALFNACIDLPQSEQISVIVSSDYPDEVKKQVLKLLNYSGDIDIELSKVILAAAQQGLNLEVIKAGKKIDQYKLIRKVGEGGQGEVWLAERDDGEFNHQVAIKFIKLSPSEKELQRFQNERELLASLQHPNISALIGGGQYNDRLFMIMEWVDGVSLFSYLNKQQLNIFDTLKCFLQICEAVSFAHSKGIIHRDIKPSNIMITADGLVKLLDFGIAKPIDAELTQTQSDAMMTFAYSSPEQITGGSVTTATDVYALGLVLYEMLTAHQAQDNTVESPAAYIQVITTKTPPRPSVQVAEQKTHNVSPFSSKVLLGDLDNLVMMSIRKEADRRYKNADELIDDINNYLHLRPLKAGGESKFYKAGKLFKRNPLASLLTAALLGFLIILPVVMYQNSVQLKQQRDKAEEQALIANKTTDFLTTLFEAVSPLGHAGKAVDLESVLAQGERQLKSDVGQQPKVTAALSEVMAAIQHHMENTPKAIEYYQVAVDAYHQSGDSGAELMAMGQLALMYFRTDDLVNLEAQIAKADLLAEQVNDPAQKAWHLLRKATVANERGEKEEAAIYAEQALALIGGDHPSVPLMNRIYTEWGEAIKYSDKELSLEFNALSLDYVKREVGSKIHPFYLNRLSSRATRLMRLNRYDEAELTINEVIDISEKLYSMNHPRYAVALGPKVTYLHDKGYFNQAEELYHQIAKIFKDSYGETHYEYARAINNLAYLYEDQGNLQQAYQLYHQSVELRTQLDPDNHIRIATANANLARVLSKLNQYQQSDVIVQEVMPVFSENKRNNLYNQIIQMANTFGDGSDIDSCQQGKDILQSLKPDIEKESAKGWRRLGAEVWIVQILKACHFEDDARIWLNSAYEMSKNIYQADSDGFKLIQQQLE